MSGQYPVNTAGTKSKSRLFFIMLAIVVAAVFVITFAVYAVIGIVNSISRSAAAGRESASVQKTEDLPGVGSPVKCGMFETYEITITGAHDSKRGEGKDGKTYLYLDVTIKNLSSVNEMPSMYLLYLKLYDEGGSPCDSVKTAPLTKTFDRQTIEPKQETKGVIAFEISDKPGNYVFAVEDAKAQKISIKASDIKSNPGDDSVYFLMGETVKFGEYEAVLKSARAVPAEGGAVLYLDFTLKNTARLIKQSDWFVDAAGLSTVEGLVHEKASSPDFRQDLDNRNIPAGKMVEGEVAFQIDNTDHDFLFYLDSFTDQHIEILIRKDEIAK